MVTLCYPWHTRRWSCRQAHRSRPSYGGNWRSVADVLIVCTAGTFSFNPLYFKWQDADGTTTDAMSGNAIMAGFDPGLSSGDLHAGQKTRGLLTFDAAAAAGGLLQLTDPLGSVLAQWKI